MRDVPGTHGDDHAPGGPDPLNWLTASSAATDFGAAVQIVPLPLITTIGDSSGFSWTRDSAFTHGGYLGCTASTAYFTFLWYLGRKGGIYGVRYRASGDVDYAKLTFSMASLGYELPSRPSGIASGKIQPTSGAYGTTPSQVDKFTHDWYSAVPLAETIFNAQEVFVVGGDEGDALTTFTSSTDPMLGYSIMDGGPGWYKAKVRVNGRNVANTTGYKLRIPELVLCRLDDDGYA